MCMYITYKTLMIHRSAIQDSYVKPEKKRLCFDLRYLNEHMEVEKKKMETLEKAKLNMDNLSVPFVDAMSKEIEFELTNSQNEWRQQLTGIMEVLLCLSFFLPAAI